MKPNELFVAPISALVKEVEKSVAIDQEGLDKSSLKQSQNTISIFDKLATQYQDKYMDVGLYHDSFNFFCDSITKQNATILELACGPGNITKYLLTKRQDFKITGIDLSPNMVALARSNNPAATFNVMDCRDIGNLHNKYDGIMCGFCLPYLSKEEAIKLIRGAYSLLHPGGVIYISTMEDDYSTSGYREGSSGDEMFMHYHEAAYLSKALIENGFKIIGLRRQDYPGTEGNEATDLLIIAIK